MDEERRRNFLMEQMQFLGQMASTETALFHQTAAAKYGLGITDVKTVSVLVQEGVMTAGQLAKRLSLTTGAITNVIDRLENRDILKRTPDAKDRRKVLVSVNLEKLKTFKDVYSSMGEVFQQLLATYTTEQLEFLVQFYQMSVELTKAELAKLASSEHLSF